MLFLFFIRVLFWYTDKYSDLAPMKESYHICYTSHNEVMFRDREDHGMFINQMALRAWGHQAEVLSSAEMSTHVHQNVFTLNPKPYAAALRMSYTKYFNKKYGRSGRMGEPNLFVLKVDGLNHQIALNNYVLRNGQHHNASPTAFGYEYCSVREAFAKELGFERPQAIITKREEIQSILPRYSEFPDQYQMDENGIFLRSSFMEIRQLEHFYVSPRNYLFQMNRLTDDSWSRDQDKDGTGKPILLQDVEAGFAEADIAQMLKNEFGRNYRPDRLQDLDVCRLIDKELLPGMGLSSVYQLSDSQRRRLSRTLYYEFHLPEQQIARCLGRH